MFDFSQVAPLFLSLLLSLSLHFYHLLILPSISPTFFLSLSSLFLSVPDTLCQPVGLSVSLFLFLSGLPPFLPHTSSSFSFTLKYVLVGCVSCRNASSDCILHPQCNNEAGLLLHPPPHFPHLPSSLLYLRNEVLLQ